MDTDSAATDASVSDTLNDAADTAIEAINQITDQSSADSATDQTDTADTSATTTDSDDNETNSPDDTDSDIPVSDLSDHLDSTDAARDDHGESDRNNYTRSEGGFDVFHWANEIDEVKNNVSVELFLFNKNYTPFRVRYSDALTASVKAMFMQEATSYIIKEADKGLECREYEKSDGEDKVIYRTKLSNVGRAETLIHLIEHEYRNIDSYTDHVDEFKKVKGILAKFSYPDNDGETKVFYIAKIISPSSALKGGTSWELNGESFEPFSAEVALKMPDDNQVAIIDDTIIIFNQSKFESLFQYDYKSQVIADEKAKEITNKYKLSFAEGLTLNSLLQDRKPLVKKLQALDISEQMPQEKLVDYADEMQLELMTDDDGSIIIMDDKDLTMFINLLDEDYFISPVNGRRYEVKSKKLLSEPEGEPPRG